MADSQKHWYLEVDQMYGLVSCDGCDGCGHVTDGPHRIPWTWHTRELRDANDKPLFEEAKKIVCGKCGGKGRIPKHMLSYDKRRKHSHQGMGG